MVCDRCVSVITAELAAIGIGIFKVSLGEVTFTKPLSADTEPVVEAVLVKNGFQILRDRNHAMIQQIKEVVAHGLARQLQSTKPVKFSELIASALHKDYNTISMQFSHSEGMTLEKYIISERIRIVQELLSKTDKSLTEISDELGYSSVSHLSRQLKSYSGFDANYYKRLRVQH